MISERRRQVVGGHREVGPGVSEDEQLPGVDPRCGGASGHGPQPTPPGRRWAGDPRATRMDMPISVPVAPVSMASRSLSVRLGPVTQPSTTMGDLFGSNGTIIGPA